MILQQLEYEVISISKIHNWDKNGGIKMDMRTRIEVKGKRAQLRKEEENLAFEAGMKEVVDAEYALRKQNKSSYDLLRDITREIFKKHKREGAMMFTERYRTTYTNLHLIVDNKKRKSLDEYLIVATNKILYVNMKKDVIKAIDLNITDVGSIYISPDKSDVLIEDEGSTRYIIRSNEFIDDKVSRRHWKDVSLSGEGYKTINFAIDKESIDIKVHYLYMFLKFGLEMMTPVILGGGSLYKIYHINGRRSDNRIDNLQIINGSIEDNLDFDTYDYTFALKITADAVEREIK